MRIASSLLLAVLVTPAVRALAAQESLVSSADSVAAAGDTAGALAVLDRAVRENARSAAAWHRRGMLAWAMALPRMRDGLVQGPEYIRLAALADSSLRLAAALAPDSAQYQLDLGRFLLRSPLVMDRRPAAQAFETALAAAARSGDNLRLAEAADEGGMSHWRRYLPLANRRALRSGLAEAELTTFLDMPAKEIESFLESSTMAYSDPPGDVAYAKASELFAIAMRADPGNARALRHAFMVLTERDAAAPQPGRAPARWSDLVISPSVGMLRRGQPLSVVWETYDLEAAADASATYRVELSLIRLGRSALSRLVARIVAGTMSSAEARARGKDQQLSLSFTRRVPAGPVALDYLTLDLGDTPPGRYRLAVRVTDLATGRRAASERDLVITR